MAECAGDDSPRIPLLFILDRLPPGRGESANWQRPYHIIINLSSQPKLALHEIFVGIVAHLFKRAVVELCQNWEGVAFWILRRTLKGRIQIDHAQYALGTQRDFMSLSDSSPCKTSRIGLSKLSRSLLLLSGG